MIFEILLILALVLNIFYTLFYLFNPLKYENRGLSHVITEFFVLTVPQRYTFNSPGDLLVQIIMATLMILWLAGRFYFSKNYYQIYINKADREILSKQPEFKLTRYSLLLFEKKDIPILNSYKITNKSKWYFSMMYIVFIIVVAILVHL